LSGRQFAIILAGLLVSSAITQFLGLHFMFGAFLFGLIMPRDAPLLSSEIIHRMEMGTVLLLPVYFVVAGLTVNLSNIGSAGLVDFLLIVLAAAVGKFGGTFFTARGLGLSRQQSAVLGTLMNTRGLTELIVLSVGLQMGVLTTGVYSLMVVMALVTTIMTGPLLRGLGIGPAEPSEPDVARSAVGGGGD
jgi:Kef-type K+ transport system membrane component KefB